MNDHRAHDYRFLIQRWREVGRASGLPLKRLVRADGYDHFYLQSKALAATGGIYISAGIHGDEPAGTEALITWAEENIARLNQWPLFLLPCLNPWGLVNNRRHNEAGFDLNRSFHREDFPLIAAVRKLVAPLNFEAAVHLHEDYDGQGLYLYEVAKVKPYWGEALINLARRSIPIENRPKIEGRKSVGGIIRPRVNMKRFETIGYPEALWLRLGHARRALTVEAPSEFALDQRVRALKAIIAECVRRVMA